MNQIEPLQFVEEVLVPAGDSDLWGRTDGVEVDVSSDVGGLPQVHPIRDKGASDLFQVHRARMFAIAYRMLGSRADAEDLLQDVYLRWHHAANDDIRSPVAFLVAITTRLCLDRLRELKQQRGQYTGPELLESAVEDHTPSPEAQIEFTEEVSAAFLAVLERLGPAERAAFLLHDLFDYEYREVAHFLGKTEATCRQVIHRARTRLRESRTQFAVSAESRARLLRRFLVAIGTGDRQAVAALLAEDVEYEAAGRDKSISVVGSTGVGSTIVSRGVLPGWTITSPERPADTAPSSRWTAKCFASESHQRAQAAARPWMTLFDARVVTWKVEVHDV